MMLEYRPVQEVHTQKREQKMEGKRRHHQQNNSRKLSRTKEHNLQSKQAQQAPSTRLKTHLQKPVKFQKLGPQI